jgi:hypothetical protein
VELRSVVSDLIKEVRELRHEKETSQENQARVQRSLSPDFSANRSKKVRNSLEPMNNKYKKAFRVCIKFILLFILFCAYIY